MIRIVVKVFKSIVVVLTGIVGLAYFIAFWGLCFAVAGAVVVGVVTFLISIPIPTLLVIAGAFVFLFGGPHSIGFAFALPIILPVLLWQKLQRGNHEARRPALP